MCLTKKEKNMALGGFDFYLGPYFFDLTIYFLTQIQIFHYPKFYKPRGAIDYEI